MTRARLNHFVWVLVAAWTATVLVAGGWNAYHTLSETKILALSETRAHLIQEQAFNAWCVSLRSVYTPVTKRTRPNPLLATLPDRDIVTPSGKELTLVSPHFMLTHSAANSADAGRVRHRLISLKPKNTASRLDNWEHAALTAFAEGQTEYSEFGRANGEPYLRLMKPLITERGCLRCHAQQGYKVGDIRGGLEAWADLTSPNAAARHEIYASTATHGACWLLGLIGIMVAKRRMARSIAERDHAYEQRRTLEERMQRAQKLESLGVLAGGIAHDFNNLLTGILSNVNLALELLPASASARAPIQKAERAALRASDLTTQMLAYSGKGRFVVELTNLNQVVNDMRQLLEASIPKKVTLRYELADDLPPIEVDRTQLRQVIMNLSTNAAEAIGDRAGVISIRTGVVEHDPAQTVTTWPHDSPPAGTFAFLEVTDTGCGMDSQTLPRIFDPFFTTKFTGRGLGLAAVLGILRGHRGAISVQSQPGQGSTFRVLLPASERTAQVAPSAKPLAKAARETGTVLIVDDEPEVLDAASVSLDRLGFRVLTAHDGHEAVELYRARADEIDVVLLDLTMPHLSGADVYRELRRTRADVRVILTSGYGEPDAFAQFAEGRPAGFIQKPYLAGALAQKLREALVV